jgi:hypothetical protein
MASSTKTAILTLSILFITVTAASCMKVRCPGIMPPIEDSATGEWTVAREKFSPDRTKDGEQESKFSIIIQYNPGEDGRRIEADDINVNFDGKTVPFTFEEQSQTLKAAVSAVFGPSMTHVFAITPSKDSVFQFPSFTLAID